MTGSDALARKRVAEIGADPAGQSDINTAMRRLVEKAQTDKPESRKPTEPNRPVSSRRDFDMAFELLEQASKAFDVLMSRCQHVEEELGAARDSAASQAVEHEQAIEKWRRLAAALKDQLDTGEQKAAALSARCDAAEARAATADTRVAALERASAAAADQAAMAESFSTKLHDKVVSAFGIGSRAHPVLQAITTQASK